MIARGVFHLHSRHSYDAKTPLHQLCREFRQRGMQFLLLTEHDDTLDAGSYARVVAECDALSDANFRAVPGIEVRCWRTEQEQWHIAALGARRWIGRGPIPEVLAAIAEAQSLAVLLHPHKYATAVDPRHLEGLHGLEIWNAKEDGRISPRAKTLALGRQAARHHRLPLYCGLDLHDLDHVADLVLEAEMDRLAEESIMTALRSGAFYLRANGFRFAALQGPDWGQRMALGCLRAAFVAYGGARRIPFLGRMLSSAREQWR